MLRGAPGLAAADARRILIVKARLENHYGETSAPSLAVLYLGAVARQQGWDVRALDTYLVHDDEAALREAIESFRPDVIALSALTSESQSMHRLARTARAAAPEALVFAGGPHPSAYPDETMEDEAIDGVAVGEGEETLRQLLEAIDTGQPWQGILGMVVRGIGGVIVKNPPQPYIEDLDTLPMPAWDLTDIDAYSRRRGMSLAGMRRYVPIMTSRGCPYRCTYCHDIQGKRFRSHSPEYVLKMMDEVGEQYGVHDFDIVDDIFNFDAARMEAICDGIIARRPRPIHFALPNGVRADRLKVHQVDKLARAGCQYAAIAIETASRRLQKQIRKHVLFDKLEPALDAFADRNVLTAGFFMVGFPSETEEELRSTIDFALQSKLHVAFFFVVTPFQGTELHTQVEQSLNGDQTRSLTRLFARQRINLSAVPDDHFFAIRRRAFLRFYFDLSRMRRTWRALPNPGHLAHLAFIMLFRDTLRFNPGLVVGPLTQLRDRWRRSRSDVVPAPATSAAASARHSDAQRQITPAPAPRTRVRLPVVESAPSRREPSVAAE